MSAPADTRLRGATRWSLAARCPRMAAYGLFGEEPAEPDNLTQMRWVRGKLDEQWWIENVLEPRVGRDNVIREKAVPWPASGLPIGELHTDAYVTTERRPYEIKSHFSGEPSEYDFVQLCGQMHFDQEVDEPVGVLVTIGRDLDWEAIPVMLTDDRIEQVEDIAAQVVRAGETGQLPERVCQRPADGRARLCPFVDACFAGWEPPDALDLSDDVAQLAVEAHQLDERRKPLKAAYDEADAAYKAAVARLNEHDIEPGRVHVGAGVTVKRSAIANRESFSLKKARTAGIWTHAHDELFGPFMSWGGGHSRYSIDTNRTATSTDDFGDEAPWTDEDLEGEPGFVF